VKSARNRFAAILCGLLSLAAFASPAEAASAPAWSLALTPEPANLAPGGNGFFLLSATNVGAAPTAGVAQIETVLPAALTPEAEAPCSAVDQVVTCEVPAAIAPGDSFQTKIGYETEASPSGSPATTASISGGGAQERTASSSPPFQAGPVPFGILPPGLSAPLTEEDGAAATFAASHPYQQTDTFQFPTIASAEPGKFVGSGHPKDVVVDLPPGLIGNPSATPVLCTEGQLEIDQCPAESAVGLLEVTTYLFGGPRISRTALYDMVPPPGAPAELGSDVAALGIFAHLIASVRSDGDYGIEVTTNDILALPLVPINGIQAQIWGDPSATSHDALRGACAETATVQPGCLVSAQSTAFWTLPGACPQTPITTSVRADSWEQPGDFAEASYQSADLAGSPVSLTGCNQLQFQPTVTVQPTTNLSDSPSGLDVDLHQPQDMTTHHTASAQLKDASVTLPAGMSVNPSQADGLAGCTLAQIGLTTPRGASPIHFSKAPQTCPDAAKLGSAEVTTPLLAQRTEGGTKLATDPETGTPLLRPLHGAVYLAKPFENPFGSLLAIYLVIEDPQTGTVAKLAGRIEPDPRTGQITTTFRENPQLPLEDVQLHLFGGARGSLITPPTCGAHTTTTNLSAWSNGSAAPSSSFQTTGAPGGGACPGSEAAVPTSVSFSAGTLGRQAGAYSPFVLKVSREDGTQRLARIETTLAPGLLGRLAGIAECSEAQIAQAESRSHPEEGILERNSPSCPGGSEVGTVTVGAGAGPTPFYTSGRAYLAGPYKGAPLSLVTITPAIAGPFDLGTVVDRVALEIEPETAQIHAVSDPFPTILDGIPLDIRSVALKMDRPGFTLNPTSCDPLAITGTLASPLGSTAALSVPFQVGGCSALPFKPRLALRLKGKVRRTAHPRLIATLQAKGGEANVARAQVKLPPAAFIDQAHIRTVCTRVQFAADACPAGSVYGRAAATTPLLSYPVSGPVYLRSSNHALPDLVAKLKGPASQPIEIDLDGKTDSVKGALRNTFEAVPDAPVSSFRLELFGGKRGLVEMSSGFCGNRRATVDLVGQNGKPWHTTPVVAAKCPKKHGKAKRHGGDHRHGKAGR
jgi:hypothetical protein